MAPPFATAYRSRLVACRKAFGTFANCLRQGRESVLARADNAEQTPEGEAAVIPEADMRRLERENILAALKQSSWRIYGPDGAAELLGIKPTTLASRVKKMGLGRGD